MAKELVLSITKKDFRIDTMRAGGPGGQHQNKTDSAVRITHIPSGAVGESRSDRSQHTNKKLALQRLTQHPKFKVWIAEQMWTLRTGKTAEQVVEEQMKPGSVKVEVQDDGRWVEETRVEG